MTDRVHPSTNGSAAIPAANGGANPAAFLANKPQLYNTARPAYRPQAPPRRRHRRGCCCSCCLWTTLLILLILLLAAIAGAAFYVLYRPHRPSFSVASLQLSQFNLTDTSLTSAFNLTLAARNRNKRITFVYDQISVKILSGDTDIGDGSLPGFVHGKRNVTTLRSVVSSSVNPFPDGTDLAPLKSSVKSRNLPVKIQLDTKVKVKIGKIEMKKLKIRVTCGGIRISIPTGKTATTATISNVECKVDPRIKIIKWTV
ncbi:hypothetical protein BUALT_Bualt02G0121100 [Buddleja alternifolia]|uniref:Late embryogenesis abundant protein LEA-2 subgroup domain-containing protein n=1 Tax=Buddleja alternifolia TaxID=168488 RepID=A0AAV6Y5T6_9LAMI|nr:hypothetical protein BUALT_Bualt02G0121100 [Buddleja alternifolia]